METQRTEGGKRRNLRLEINKIEKDVISVPFVLSNTFFFFIQVKETAQVKGVKALHPPPLDLLTF